MTKRIATSGETKRLLNKHNFHIKKSLGQNFIIDPNIIDGIVHAAELDEQDLVVEIGPGMGSLTEGLLGAAGQVLAIELDRALIPILEEGFGGRENFSLVNADALKVDYDELVAPLAARGDYRPGFVVVANLPYYVTTPIMMNLLEGGYGWRRLVLMVQKEVAARMQASPGTKDYGALSLGVQYRAAVRMAMRIPPTVFIPRPAVDSAIVILERLAEPPVAVRDERLLFRLVAAAFGQRRKTMLNSISSGLHLDKAVLTAVLAELGIDGGRRGETLSLAEFALLADAIGELPAAE